MKRGFVVKQGKVYLLLLLVLLSIQVALAADEREIENPLKDGAIKKRIALTFDDGPNREATPRILATLEKHQVKATFFIVGWRVYSFKDQILQIARDGHDIGNHSYDHPYLNKLKREEIEEQLNNTNLAVKKVTGMDIKIYRPPYASYDERVLSIGNDLNMQLILWTINPEDWRSPGAEKIIKRIVGNAQDGSIVLLHDKKQTADALPKLILSLKEKGFEFVTISELLRI